MRLYDKSTHNRRERPIHGHRGGSGVGFTTGLLHLRKGLGMRETPIRPHSWHCRMQSDYQYD